MTELSGTSATTATAASNASSSKTVTTDNVNWEKEYQHLLSKYNDVLKELSKLGLTLLNYANTMQHLGST